MKLKPRLGAFDVIWPR